MDWYWSWILSAVGLLGFFLAGSKVWWAWYVNIFNQVIWTVYAIATEQWGFLVGTAFYFVVFIRNAVMWTKEHQATKLFTEYPPTEDQKPNQKILLKGNKTVDKFDLADVLSDAIERLRYTGLELERAQRDYDESLSVTYRNKRTLDHLKRKVYLENCVIAAVLDTQLDAEDTSEPKEKGDD